MSGKEGLQEVVSWGRGRRLRSGGERVGQRNIEQTSKEGGKERDEAEEEGEEEEGEEEEEEEEEEDEEWEEEEEEEEEELTQVAKRGPGRPPLSAKKPGQAVKRGRGRPPLSAKKQVGQSDMGQTSKEKEPEQVAKRGRGRPRGSVTKNVARDIVQALNDESEEEGIRQEVDVSGLTKDLAQRVEQFPAFLHDSRKRTKEFLSRHASENTIYAFLERMPQPEDEIDDVWTAEDVEHVRSTFEDCPAWERMRTTPIVNNHYFWSMWRGICYVMGVTPMHIISPRRLLAYGAGFEENDPPRTDWSANFCDKLTKLALGSPCGNNMALLSWFIRYTAACFEDDRRRVPFGDHEEGHKFLDNFACAMRATSGEKTIPDVLKVVLKEWPQPPWYAAAMKIVGREGLRLGKGSFKAKAGRGVYKPYRITTPMLTKLIEAFDGVTERGSSFLQPVETMYSIRKPRLRQLMPKDEEDLDTLRRPMLLDELCFAGKMEEHEAREVFRPNLQVMWGGIKRAQGERIKRIMDQIKGSNGGENEEAPDEGEEAPNEGEEAPNDGDYSEEAANTGMASPRLGAGPGDCENPFPRRSNEDMSPPEQSDRGNFDMPQDGMELGEYAPPEEDLVPGEAAADDAATFQLGLARQGAELQEGNQAREEEIARIKREAEVEVARLKHEAEKRQRDHDEEMASVRERMKAGSEEVGKKRKLLQDFHDLKREKIELERDLERKNREMQRSAAALKDIQEAKIREIASKLEMADMVTEAEARATRAEKEIVEERRRAIEAVGKTEEAWRKILDVENNAVRLVMENERLKAQLREAHEAQQFSRSSSATANQWPGFGSIARGVVHDQPEPARERITRRVYRGTSAPRVVGQRIQGDY